MVFLVTLVAVGSSFAQGGQGRGGTPEERLKRDVDQLTTALTLTPAQVAKVTSIIADAQKKSAETFAKMREAGGTPDRAKMQEERAKIQAETDKALKAALPADMGAKFDAFCKKQAEERAARQNN